MPLISTAVAARALAKPLQDIYEGGKAKFEKDLAIWRNAATRKQLASKIATVQKVKAFWQRDKEIPLSAFYYPSKIIFHDVPTRKNADSLAAFPSAGNFVIQGTVGQGKSIFLRHLCVQELRESGSGRIPIFVELRSVTAAGLKAMMFSSFERLGFKISEPLFEYYASTGKIVLLLDAFDELDEQLVKQTITELETFAEKYPKLQIFVTSRRHSAVQASRLFRVVNLAPLQKVDHEPFLKRLGVRGEELKRLMRAIENSSARISDLLRTPLMLTLLVIVYRAESAIPQELPDFYEKLFETLFSKHDSSKPGYIRKHRSGLGERQLQQLFEAFCFSCIQQKNTTKLSASNFYSCLEHALKHVNCSCDTEGFKHDITRVTCLMQEEGFDIVFIHKSVMEFYAASFVRSRNEDAAKRFYTQLIKGPWGVWRQVLVFLSQIDKYRFAKYYAIPAINLSAEIVGVDPEATDIDDAMPILHKIYNGVTISFEGMGFNPERDDHPADRVFFSEASGFTDVTLQISELTDIFLPYIDDDALDGMSLEDIQDQYPNAIITTHIRDTTIEIPLDDFLSSSQKRKLAEETKEAILEMLELRREFVRFVIEEESKAPLIDL